jgi:hypothetical protein
MTTLALLAAWAVSVPVPWEVKLPAAEPVMHRGLAITVQPSKRIFGPRDELVFLVEFRNESTGPRLLGVTDGPGGQTVGFYEYTFRDPETDRVWQVGADPQAMPPGAAAPLGFYQVQAARVLTTRITLPGTGRLFWQGGTEKAPEKTSSHLPPGRYEVVITMKMPDGIARTKPARFYIADK